MVMTQPLVRKGVFYTKSRWSYGSLNIVTNKAIIYETESSFSRQKYFWSSFVIFAVSPAPELSRKY